MTIVRENKKMKLPNGYGSVTKLSGKRRKPYMVRITTCCEYNEELDEYVQKRAVLGYFAKKSEALEALAEYSKNPYSILESTMSVKELWEAVKVKVDASEHRMRAFETNFDKYMTGIADMKIRDVKPRHLQQVIDECPHGYSTKSVIRCVMNHIFNYAAQNDLITKNYAHYVKLEPEAVAIERQVYTDEEIRKMWDKKDLEEYALTLVLLHQGMRIKEFMDLSDDDIDLVNKTITIREGKNRYAKRTIPINENVIDLVTKFKEAPPSMTRGQYYHFTKKILDHTPYDVRHTFATKCSTLDIKKIIIQKIMGHKPDSILENVYIHLTIDELAEAINRVKY